MEFLDEQAKRRRAIKLFTGYFLIAVIIALSSLILVYLAQGYGYDPQKGVMQNGLVFVDSYPIPANVTLDNQSKGTASLRLVLPEGQHSLTLSKDKYRSWSKSFSLDGGSVLYFIYPRLFPVDIPLGVTRVYTTPPAWASQSPDRHWLIMQAQTESPVLTLIDLSKPNDDPKLISIPASELTVQNGHYGTLKPLEWSNDNKHLLLSETMPSGRVVYIMFDRENSDQTVNLSDKLQLDATQKVVLLDKKYDRYYIHDTNNGELKTADIKNGLSDNPLLAGVVSYKSFSDNLIFYTTYENAKPTEAKLFVLSGNKDKFLLKSLPRNSGNIYLLDMAKYQNNWYYVASSVGSNKVYLFRNPLSRDKPGNKQAIAPQMSLSLENPQFVSFSDNTRFIAMQSGKNFVVFDGEQSKVFKYSSPLDIQLTQQAKWMDGHRLDLVTSSKVQVFDFDGTNQQTLIASRPEFTPYFNRDYTYVFTLVPQADGKTALENGKLIVNNQ